ncbi:MAG: hypothetical protein KA807_07460 [Prolixibacteraceae bacterium]|nr:hypothetical protein [Prolixibacteraceae bacterium]
MKNNLFEESLLGRIYFRYFKNKKFSASDEFWEKRYQKGKDSGSGSYNRLAEFKAEVINNFVRKNNIQTIIEFGCGDGNQLRLADYPNYIGLDVSKTTLQNCINIFRDDKTKSFMLYNSNAFVDNHNIIKAELSMSLDVIYHLVEDSIFKPYMSHLFNSASKYVIIYSSNRDNIQQSHVRERNFSKWVDENCKEWELAEVIKNKYPYDTMDPDNTSISDFFIYRRKKFQN